MCIVSCFFASPLCENLYRESLSNSVLLGVVAIQGDISTLLFHFYFFCLDVIEWTMDTHLPDS